MNRKAILIFTLIITLSASIFYFMQDDKPMAYNALFIGLYISLALYLVLRILFYFRYKATLNEIFFVLYSNIFATVIILAGPYTPLTNDYFFSLTANNTQLDITLVSILALPFFVISLVLEIRSFTKYEFYRISPTSEKGPSAEWIAILAFFIFGATFLFVGMISSDLLAAVFGSYYLLSGFVFLLAK